VKYRSRTEIVSEILELAKGDGISKTKIMYGAYLSFSQLKEYLNLLLYNGMLSYNKGSNRYRTTQKGMDFLKAHKYIDGMLG
jgi:predicted transcriptional regulator